MSQDPESSLSQTQSQPQTQSQSGSSSSSAPGSGSQTSSSSGSGTLSSVDTIPVRDLASIPEELEEPEPQPWGRLLPMERGFRVHSKWGLPKRHIRWPVSELGVAACQNRGCFNTRPPVEGRHERVE